MLRDAGASAVIVGHSERRRDNGETNALVAKKAFAARRAGLMAIVCVGETQRQRDAGAALAFCGEQIMASVPPEMTAAGLAIGYEPLWAIGSGKVPSSGEIADMHAHLRSCLVGHLGAEGSKVRILYGGSVNPDDARMILALPEVGGALVGGASLHAEPFLAIAASAGRS
jgi:triosephosphate isomerase